MADSRKEEDPAALDAPEMLDPNDAAEIIEDDGDAAMDSDDAMDEADIQEEISLQNDSSAHFAHHPDSIFCIAQHPVLSNITATGGSEGEDDGGIGFIFDSTPADSPVLPSSYQSDPSRPIEREGLAPIYKIEGHSDSINTLAFSLPRGEFLLSGGLDGRLRVHTTRKPTDSWTFMAEAQEVPEINWLAPCPNPAHPNTFALGASDGSVWVYTIDASNVDAPLQIVQSFFLHTATCTAGAWTPQGDLLATVGEDSALYVWDVFGEAAAQGLTTGQTVVTLTADDQRFAVEGGLFSVAVAPSGSFVAVGGTGGAIKIVGLPRMSDDVKGQTAKTKNKSGKGSTSAASSQAGQILADLQAQSDGVESLSFAPAPLTLLAAGSVDGSIILYDTAQRFGVRRHIKEAHEGYSVVKVEFLAGGSDEEKWLLTSCGLDGVLRRWDTRGQSGAGESGFVREWKGHRGEGDGGGILGFVQCAKTRRIVTAGDDGISLVFEHK